MFSIIIFHNIHWYILVHMYQNVTIQWFGTHWNKCPKLCPKFLYKFIKCSNMLLKYDLFN